MAAMFTPGALGALQGQQPDATEDDTVDPTTLQSVMSQMAVLRDKELANRQKSWDMVAQRLEKSRPSKAEMWFSLASALAQPTKTGSFGETLGNTAEALGKSAAERREYETKVADTMLQRDQDLAELGSKYDLKGIELGIAANKAANKPLGNVGVDPNTGERFYTTGRFAGQNLNSVGAQTPSSGSNLPVGSIVSGRSIGMQNDMKYRIGPKGPELLAGQENVAQNAEAVTGAKSDIRSFDLAEGQLKRALELNSQSFDGPLGEIQRGVSRFVSPNDPKLKASAQLETILGQNVVDSLRSSFGGNPTEGERTYLESLSGRLKGATASEREAIINEGLNLLSIKRQRSQGTIESRSPQSSRQTAPIAPPSKNLPPLTTFYKK